MHGVYQPENGPTYAYEDGCALNVAATYIVSCFPKLQRLFITWYEEDDLSAEGIAKALLPLNEMEELKEVQLLRSGGNCGWLVSKARAAAAAIAQLPTRRRP